MKVNNITATVLFSNHFSLRAFTTSAAKPKVIICGGGLTGASVAYHLAKKGWGRNTVLMDRFRIGYGGTKDSSGLVSMINPSLSSLKHSRSSIKLWNNLQSKGLNVGWKQCGTLMLARTRDRLTDYKRIKSQFTSWNLKCEIVSSERCREFCSSMQTDDILGGLWLPEEGVGDPFLTCKALIEEAVNEGLTVMENCDITNVITKNGRVYEVDTSQGKFKCDYFVNCAGFWARKVSQLSKPSVKMPLYGTSHYCVSTTPVEISIPAVIDPDGQIYFREKNRKLVIGGFQSKFKSPALTNIHNLLKNPGMYVDDDWNGFHHIIEQILYRLPSLKDVKLDRLYSFPETYSPDFKWIIGETPEISKYFVMAGFNTTALSSVSGVGEAVADIIVNGQSKCDVHDIDINRFLSLHNNEKFLVDRVHEVSGMFYDIHYPFREFKTGRNLRMSPIYTILKEKGAVFNQIMGYERPAWFDEDHIVNLDSKHSMIATTNTFGKPHWFNNVKKEYMACREAIGLCDYSSFTKIDFISRGTELVDVLQYLCSNNVDVPVGSIIHTGMQNELGGYENDCSLVRLAPNRYMMIAPTIQQTRCNMWISRHLPRDGSVTMTDVTSMYTAICLMGPFTRVLLSELTDTDLSPSNFPFFTYKELDVGLANGIRALNLTHTGELGYVLYIPNEFALHVYSRLIEVGEKYGIMHVGYYAMRTLRVEKFYAFWGQDLDTVTTPLECGRTWRVKFDKPVNFIGKEALLKQREEGIKRQYVQLLLNDHDYETDFWSWGGEPIYRNGKYCGHTTTTSYGFTFQKQVCLGFIQNIDEDGNLQIVNNKFVLSGDYEVDIAGIRYNAKVNLHSPNLPTKYPDIERESYKATREKLEGLSQSN